MIKGECDSGTDYTTLNFITAIIDETIGGLSAEQLNSLYGITQR